MHAAILPVQEDFIFAPFRVCALDANQLKRRRTCLCGMPGHHIFLHKRLFQNFLCMTSANSALSAHSQPGLQIPHPVGASMDSLTNCGIGYTFADTNVHMLFLAHFHYLVRISLSLRVRRKR
jgi:hypothetical protein